jgi:hypothetical protein
MSGAGAEEKMFQSQNFFLPHHQGKYIDLKPLK